MIKEFQVKKIKFNPGKIDSFLISLKEHVSQSIEYYNNIGRSVTKDNIEEFERAIFKTRKKFLDYYFEYLNDSYSNILYKRKDFLEDINYLDDILIPKVTKRLYESMKDILLDGKVLIWNENKTESEWKKRITSRTKMSYDSFYSLIQKGLNQVSKQICTSGDTCIIFQKSQFILIVNKSKNYIVSIRDTKWDKPIGDKPCKRAIIFESDEHALDIINNVFFNEMDFEGYSLYSGEDIHEIGVETKCSCCIEIDL